MIKKHPFAVPESFIRQQKLFKQIAVTQKISAMTSSQMRAFEVPKPIRILGESFRVYDRMGISKFCEEEFPVINLFELKESEEIINNTISEVKDSLRISEFWETNYKRTKLGFKGQE